MYSMHHFGIFRLRIYDARCAKYKICIVCIISGYFACGEDSLREFEVDSMSKLIEPLLRSSVYMMHAVLNIKYV